MSERELADLVTAARAASASNRVELFRDRLAAFGPPAVAPLLQLHRDDPALGFFVATVLRAVGEKGSAEAWTALRRLGRDTSDAALKRFINQKLPRPDLPRPAHAAPPRDVWSPHRPAVHRPSDPVERINQARRRRSEPVLDEAEAGHVLDNLRRRELDPNRYRSTCWVCWAVVDESTNPHCGECRWLVCWCGACREPRRPWPRPRGPIGPCRNEAYLFAEELSYPDRDYLGRPILTAVAPAGDAAIMRDLLARHAIGSVYHWSPERSIKSILCHGILSRRELRRRDIREFVAHGYGSPDKEMALAGFVGVAFRVKRLMMRDWSTTPVLLELDPEVLVGAGTRFIPGNSASSRFSAVEVPALTGAEALGKLFAGDHVLVDVQAEAWVKDRVPSIAIRALHVATSDLAQPLEAHLREEFRETRPIPPIVISPAMFA